jgi:hypothetical protein
LARALSVREQREEAELNEHDRAADSQSKKHLIWSHSLHFQLHRMPPTHAIVFGNSQCWHKFQIGLTPAVAAPAN